MNFFFLLAFCLLSQSIAYAQAKTESPAVLCVNDKDGKKGAENQAINKMIAQASDPLAEAYRSYATARCAEALDGPPTMRQFLKIANLYKPIDNYTSDTLPTFIKKQCIEASLQRDIDQTGYACEKGKPKSFENAGTNKKGKKDTSDIPCLNQESVDYIHYSVNLAIKCFATIRDPIDPRILLKKINTETGFNFFLASTGGTGLGQLTSDPVKELAGQKTNKGEGNARSVLQDLAASTDSSCEPFKRVLEKDLNTPPPTPPIDNVCKYVAANDGFARALIMGMGYYVYNRDEVVVPFLQKNLGEEAAKNKELINLTTLLSYGPKGPNGALAYLERKGFKKNKKLTAAAGIETLKKAPYVSESEDRYAKQLLPFLKASKPANPDKPDKSDKKEDKGPTKEELRGDSCVGR
jgi:hypothetical protein